MAVDTQSFLVSLVINSAICLFCFIIFSILRTAQLTCKFYAPKRYAFASRRGRAVLTRTELRIASVSTSCNDLQLNRHNHAQIC